jgi:hypothetical protein
MMNMLIIVESWVIIYLILTTLKNQLKIIHITLEIIVVLLTMKLLEKEKKLMIGV